MLAQSPPGSTQLPPHRGSRVPSRTGVGHIPAGFRHLLCGVRYSRPGRRVAHPPPPHCCYGLCRIARTNVPGHLLSLCPVAQEHEDKLIGSSHGGSRARLETGTLTLTRASRTELPPCKPLMSYFPHLKDGPEESLLVELLGTTGKGFGNLSVCPRRLPGLVLLPGQPQGSPGHGPLVR